MTRIHILSRGFDNPNSAAFVMPFIQFSRAIKEAGLSVRIFYTETPRLLDCDFLFIEHKALSQIYTPEQILEKLAHFKTQTRLIWCDQSDSTGTFWGQVLPHVHGYLKAQILSDLTGYTKTYHSDRIYGDYYHQKYGVRDDIFYDYKPARSDADLSKIHLSWNSGLMHYGYIGPYLQRLRSHLPLDAMLHFAQPLARANRKRTLDIAARMGISYPRATMRFQRAQIREKLKAYIPTDKLSRRAYFKEMTNSKICVSPFGLGEITLKDFECFLTGSMLLKPDMNHMRTWPNFYEDGQTCLMHDWDLDNLEEKIEWARTHEQERIDIAQAGQDRFIAHTIGVDAPALFVDHLSALIQRLG